MKAGKLSESVLKRSVLKQLHIEKTDILEAPGIGVDFGMFGASQEENVVAATATRCIGNSVIYEASLEAALNNLYCSGARPVGVTLNFLLPTSLSENTFRDHMLRIRKVCEREKISVLGGHTEVIRSVTEPLLTVTALGLVKTESVKSFQSVKPGMDIILTKWIALEGTAILAMQREKELRNRYAQPFIDRAKAFAQYLSIRSEAAVAAQSGVAAMHDISEGGVFGALWEMGQRFGVGLSINLKQIPIRQETVEICEFFDLNPYKMLSGGSMVIAALDGTTVVRSLQQKGIAAVIAGKVTDSNDRVILNGEECRFLETTQTDELWKIKG